MVPFFPKQIATRGFVVYLMALTAVSLFFFDYKMETVYIIVGLAFVSAFFFLSSNWSRRWINISEKVFLRRVFAVSLIIRLIWVVFSYYYYAFETGIPFEYDAADSIGYHEEAAWLASEPWSVALNYYFGHGSMGVSDVGYPLYLMVLYKIFGPVILVPRILKALISAFTCILVYQLCKRSIGVPVARICAIMFSLMPNLILYCGYHLKETEMLFLSIAFLDRTDYLFRSRNTTFWSILFPTLLAGVLFLYRTVLGAAAVFAFVTGVLLSTTPTMRKSWRKVAILGWLVLCAIVIGGGTILTEIQGYWEDREINISNKRTEQTIRGNQWAQYATGSVMMPMVFVLPFSTMVDVEQQYGQQEKHSGNYIRNFMGFFAVLAFIEAIRRKKWKDFSLIGAFTIAYLGVVSFSGFSNSERFLLPGLPGLMIMWGYGISTLHEKTYKYFTPWCVVVFIMECAWAYFKLGSRGIF